MLLKRLYELNNRKIATNEISFQKIFEKIEKLELKNLKIQKNPCQKKKAFKPHANSFPAFA